MSDDFIINDQRRVDGEGNVRPVASTSWLGKQKAAALRDEQATRPATAPDLDGLYRYEYAGHQYVAEMVNGELRILSKDGFGELRHSHVTCPECGEVKMQISTDPITTHRDCRRHPANAAMGALYPQGPPNSDRRLAPPAALRRSCENYDTDGMEREMGNQMRTLERLVGVRNGGE